MIYVNNSTHVNVKTSAILSFSEKSFLRNTIYFNLQKTQL